MGLCVSDLLPTPSPAWRIQQCRLICLHSETWSSPPPFISCAHFCPLILCEWIPPSSISHSEDMTLNAAPHVRQTRKARRWGGKGGRLCSEEAIDVTFPSPAASLADLTQVPSDAPQGRGSTCPRPMPSIQILLAALTSLEQHFKKKRSEPFVSPCE